MCHSKVKLFMLHIDMADDKHIYCSSTGRSHEELDPTLAEYCFKCGKGNPFYKIEVVDLRSSPAQAVSARFPPSQAPSTQAQSTQPISTQATTVSVARFAHTNPPAPARFSQFDHRQAEAARQGSIANHPRTKNLTHAATEKKHPTGQVGRAATFSFELFFVMGFRPATDKRPLVEGKGWKWELFRMITPYIDIRMPTNQITSSWLQIVLGYHLWAIRKYLIFLVLSTRCFVHKFKILTGNSRIS